MARPLARYAPLRGTQHDLVAFLRRSDWAGPIGALAAALSRPEGNVWLAVGSLDTRGLIHARREADGSVRIWLTRTGRAIRL